MVSEGITRMCHLAERDKNRLFRRVLLPTLFMQLLTADSDHAKAISNATEGLLLPYSVVKNTVFICQSARAPLQRALTCAASLLCLP